VAELRDELPAAEGLQSRSNQQAGVGRNCWSFAGGGDMTGALRSDEAKWTLRYPTGLMLIAVRWRAHGLA